MNTPLPELQGLRQVARLFDLQGRVGLRTGNAAIVRENLDALLGLKEVPAGYPILVAQLVSIAMDTIAMGLLKDAIEHDVLSDADLTALLPKVLLAIDVGDEWKSTIAGERAMALPLFSDPTKARGAGLPALPGRSHDALLYLDLSERVMDVPSENLMTFKSKLRECDMEFRAMTNSSFLSKFDSIMTEQTLPAIGACGDVFIRRALQHRMAALAMGLRLHEDRNASLPSSLGALTEVPLDVQRLMPTTGLSFGFRKDGENALLWGGSLKDSLTISAEPHPAESEGEDEHAKSSRQLWLWKLPAGKK